VLYLPEEVDWIKFNVDMSGYYIVHYEGSGWDDLIRLLKHNHTALSSNDRASLINNAFQLVRSVLSHLYHIHIKSQTTRSKVLYKSVGNLSCPG